MDYDTFDTDIFSEINDMPGEIYDVIEYKEEYEDDKKFDVESYIKGNTDYWWNLLLFVLKVGGWKYQTNYHPQLTGLQLLTHLTLTNIMLKQNLLKVIKTTAQSHTLNRNEKFYIFCDVCDKMLAEGRISEIQHERWTNVF